jgi:hypothetical protein
MLRLAPALALTVVLATAAACGGDDMTDHDGMSMSDSPAGPVQVSVVVTGGDITPAPKTYDVALGDEVSIKVTSDVAEEVHLHGYDKMVELEPGVAGEVTFTADIPGVFEAELEDAGLKLFELKVE